MAYAGAKWYMPIGWPATNVGSTLVRSPDESPPEKVAVAATGILGHLTAVFISLRSFVIAYVCVFWLFDEYPAFGPGKEFRLQWMMPIVVRNVVGTTVLCGFWDWFLYFSPLKGKLHKYKMNPKYPSRSQFLHDASRTIMAVCCGAILEILMCYAWANNIISHDTDLSADPLQTLLCALTITHMRQPHFWFKHRIMHPWRISGIPDVGKFLYRHVHSIHHKSHNPSAFSGSSVHPVEAFMYFGACKIPFLFGFHPVFGVATIIDAAMTSWTGHDGFQWPGAGNYHHYLHHKHFDCNYGGPLVPMDVIFGTFAATKEDVRKIWRSEDVGEDGNHFPTHPDSMDSHKVD